MKFKHQAIASLSLLLISTDIAAAQTISLSAIESLSPSSNLSKQQQNEIEQILETQIQKSASVNDQIESIVSSRFNITIGLLTMMTAVFTLIPIGVSLLLFSSKTFIKDQIINVYVKEVKKIIETEVINIIEQRIEGELTIYLNEFKQRLEAFKQMLTDDEDAATKAQSNFSNSLERLSSEVEKAEKRIASEIVNSLERLSSEVEKAEKRIASEIVSDEKIITMIASSPELISQIAASPVLGSTIATSIARGELQREVMSLLPKMIADELLKTKESFSFSLPFKGRGKKENKAPEPPKRPNSG